LAGAGLGQISEEWPASGFAKARAEIWFRYNPKGAITSKIKHAIKHKTSPARLAQLLQPSLAFCLSLQPMTAYHPVHWLQTKTKW